MSSSLDKAQSELAEAMELLRAHGQPPDWLSSTDKETWNKRYGELLRSVSQQSALVWSDNWLTQLLTLADRSLYGVTIHLDTRPEWTDIQVISDLGVHRRTEERRVSADEIRLFRGDLVSFVFKDLLNKLCQGQG